MPFLSWPHRLHIKFLVIVRLWLCGLLIHKFTEDVAWMNLSGLVMIDELKSDDFGVVGGLLKKRFTLRYTTKLPISLVYPSSRYFLLWFYCLERVFFRLFFFITMMFREEFFINWSALFIRIKKYYNKTNKKSKKKIWQWKPWWKASISLIILKNINRKSK